MDIGSVSGEIGILPEYREVTGTPPGEVMGHMGLSGERVGLPEVGRAPPPSWSELY